MHFPKYISQTDVPQRVRSEAQEERISILRQALSEKGLSSHYAGTSPSRISQPETRNRDAAPTSNEEDEDEGIHL